jgi:integrase
MATNDHDALEEFSPEKFVRGLNPQQLEFLSEFYDQAEAQLELLASGTKMYKAPTGTEMLKVFQAAETELMNRNLLISHALDDERDGDVAHTTAKREWFDELLHEIPQEQMKKGKREGLRLPAAPTRTEIQELLSAALQDSRNGERNHMIIRIFYASGIRRNEIVNIIKADLYLDRNVIFIRSGKADKDRYVLIDQDTSNLLRSYTQDLKDDEILFDMSTRTINRVVERAVKDSGLKTRYDAMGRKFTVHSLRHAYATHMYEAGADIFLLKTLMGHYSLSVTKMYIYVGVGLLSERYSTTHPFARPKQAKRAKPMPTKFTMNIPES